MVKVVKVGVGAWFTGATVLHSVFANIVFEQLLPILLTAFTLKV